MTGQATDTKPLESVGNARVATVNQLIAILEEEKRAMLECARLNPRETGNSIYMQMAIWADKKANALRLALAVTE